MKRHATTCPRMLAYKPPRIAMTLLLTAGALQHAAPSVWPTMSAFPASGLVLGTFGFGIMLRAWWLFRRRSTAICPTAKTTSLVTDDVYRLTRNPMYLGILWMLLGVSVATGCVPCLVASLFFFLIIEFVFCPFEEAKLEQAFGNDYARYRNAVRRWL
jgi:protein-S-isoprenylcysteine O-methyltransferase Ste14